MWPHDDTTTTRAGALVPEAVEEQLAEQEVAQVVGLELGLESVDGLLATRQDAPGVQVEHVDLVETVEEVGGAGPHRGQAGQIEGHALDGIVAARPSDVGHGLRPPAGVGAT